MPATISEYVPQCAPDGGRARAGRRALAVWSAASACALLFVAAIVAAPSLLAGGRASLAGALYAGFGAVCHQIAERSFFVSGFPLAVCARCAGLYVGFALGVVLYPLVRPVGARETPERAWLIAAALPMATDVGLNLLGVWENTHLSRSLTGALLGAVAALYVVPGLVDLSHASRGRLFRARSRERVRL